jgi:cytochrome c oxidase cbb3-type subunit II
MKSETTLIGGSLIMLAIATFVLVVLPYLQLRHVEPAKGLRPYTRAELRGREVYIQQGCLYCHSQQPTVSTVAPDGARGWGRPAVAADYYYDRPHLLGGSRTGPDLFNIGARQPSADWHLGHLFQPRAYVAGSIMPSYRYLFELKDRPEPEDRVVTLPPGFVPAGRLVIAKPAALDLVKYLQSLDHTYPVVEGTPLAN